MIPASLTISHAFIQTCEPKSPYQDGDTIALILYLMNLFKHVDFFMSAILKNMPFSFLNKLDLNPDFKTSKYFISLSQKPMTH